MHTGSCLCGTVRFEVSTGLKEPDACHCSICRRTSGHYWVSTDVPRSAITLHGLDNITWYQSSAKVRRGFCRTCGSAMFFDPPATRDWIGVAMGAFDKPTNTKIHEHIFVVDKGDYYELGDGVLQYETTP